MSNPDDFMRDLSAQVAHQPTETELLDLHRHGPQTVTCRTAADWRALIGQHVAFEYFQDWEDLPFDCDGVLEGVSHPHWHTYWVEGEWGGVVPDSVTRVTVVEAPLPWDRTDLCPEGDL